MEEEYTTSQTYTFRCITLALVLTQPDQLRSLGALKFGDQKFLGKISIQNILLFELLETGGHAELVNITNYSQENSVQNLYV